MKFFRIIPSAAIITLSPCTASAKLSCPEGTDAYINAENYELVCIPQSINLAEIITNATNNKLNPDPPQTSNPTVTADEGNHKDELQAKETTQDDKTNPIVNPLEEQNDFAFQQSEAQTEDEAPDLFRYENNASSGFTAGAGVGYGILIAADFNVFLGYNFFSKHNILLDNSKKPVSNFGFGIYANLHGNVGWPNGINADISPALLIVKGNFRINIGIGFGYSKNGVDDDIISGFLLSPDLKLHWFVTDHLFLGFGATVPIAFGERSSDSVHDGKHEVSTLLNIYFSIGFKLSSK